MRSFIKVGISGALVAAIAAVALAGPGTVIGIWHGQLRFDPTKLSNDSNPGHNKVIQSGMRAAQHEKFTLVLKGNHSFTLTTTGGPKSNSTAFGTWSVSGKSISITPNSGGKPGRTMSFAMTGEKSFSHVEGPIQLSFFR